MLIALSLPMLFGAGALAVDVGVLTLESRKLQGAADAAALAAAADPARAKARANETAAAAGWDRPVGVQVWLGRYDPAARDRFGPATATSPGTGDAVRVVLTTEAPTFLARIFGRDSVTVARAAVAARQRAAAFSIGGRLAALDGGALNGLLSALSGSQVSLSLVDYEGLASADLDAVGVVGLMRARLGMSDGTYAAVLDRTVPAGEVFAAMADAASGPAAAALRRLTAQAGPATVRLGDLLDLGPYMAQAQGGEGLVALNALSFVTQVLRGGSGARTVGFDAGGTRVTLAYAGGVTQSPWIGVSEAGGVIVRTAAARLRARTALPPAGLPGLALPASLELPLYVEAGRAEARLADIACPAPDRRGVTLDARAGPASAAIAEVSDTALSDFTRAAPLADARLLRAPLVAVDGRAETDAGAAEPWQQLFFDETAIRARAPRAVAGAHPLTGVAESLARGIQLKVRVAGLPVPAGALGQAVGTQLLLAAPALDALLALVTGAAGLRLGEAEARVTGVRCGTAALVG